MSGLDDKLREILGEVQHLLTEDRAGNLVLEDDDANELVAEIRELFVFITPYYHCKKVRGAMCLYCTDSQPIDKPPQGTKGKVKGE